MPASRQAVTRNRLWFGALALILLLGKSDQIGNPVKMASG
jgi:hypothetical protein